MKNHKIANNSATTEARVKINTNLESLGFYKTFYVCLTKLKNNQILLNKISHRLLMTTKPLLGERASLKAHLYVSLISH